MLDPNKVYSIDDLENWPEDIVSLAILGHPVKHSMSPCMHNAALQELAKENSCFENWSYYKFDIKPEDLEYALPVFHSKGFRGMNLTVPHKVQVVPFVSISDTVAGWMGAVNTLRRKDSGYEGFNTDGYGLAQAIKTEFGASSQNAFEGESVILLGAGGAARGAAVQCLHAGCRELWIGNRNQERLAELQNVLAQWETRVHGFKIDQLPEGIPYENCIIINSTTLGMNEGDPVPVDLSRFGEGARVYDMVYSPLKTALLLNAEKYNMPSSNGLPMLVWQGAKALQIWINDYMTDSDILLDQIGNDMQKAIATAMSKIV